MAVIDKTQKDKTPPLTVMDVARRIDRVKNEMRAKHVGLRRRVDSLHRAIVICTLTNGFALLGLIAYLTWLS